MRAIMVMFDSLRRDWLPPYGGTANLPNFRRLAEKTVVFDQHYAGSLPCMVKFFTCPLVSAGTI